jgi:hypothetical protein
MLSSADGCMCSYTTWKLPGRSPLVASTGAIAFWVTPNPLSSLLNLAIQIPRTPFPTCFVDKWMGLTAKWLEYCFYQQAHRSLPYASPTGTFRLLLSPSCGHSGAHQVLVIELSPAVNFDCEPCSISTMQLFLPRPKVTLSFELTSSVSLA